MVTRSGSHFHLLRIATLVAILVAVALPADPGRAAAAVPTETALFLDGEAGDWVSGGSTQTITPAGGAIFTATLAPADPGYVDVIVDGASTPMLWHVTLAAPAGEPIAPGTYTGATRPSTRGPGEPAIEIHGEGRGCNQTSGEFTIHELSISGTGALQSFAATFRQRCDNSTADLYGEIRVGSTFGFHGLTMTPNALDAGDAAMGASSALPALTVTNVGSLPLTFTTATISGPDAADFHVATDSCVAAAPAPGSTCTVDLTVSPSKLGTLAATLTVHEATARSSRSITLAANGTPSGALPSSVVWGSMRPLPNYSFNVVGASLGRTVSTPRTYLHAAHTTDRVGGRWVTDRGPRAGVNYVRTSNDGSTWTTAKRLNPSSQHGSRASLATSGSRVYVTWVSTTRWVAYRPTAPRVLYIRVNTNHGSSSSWKAAKRLTSLKGRVDWPTVAAAGRHVYVAYTDSVTRKIRVKISHDRGLTWRTVTIGTVTGRSSSGYSGVPHVAAHGSTVTVAWAANASGAVRIRTSTNAGASWTAPVAIATSSTSYPAVAALGSRVAVAWTKDDGVHVRVRTSGVWGTVQTAPAPTGSDYLTAYAPAVALNETSRLGVAWAGCAQACNSFSSQTHVDLVWSESLDGTEWKAGQLVGSSAASSRRFNDSPSIIWAPTGARHVLFSAGTAGTNAYRLFLRTGTGLP